IKAVLEIAEILKKNPSAKPMTVVLIVAAKYGITHKDDRLKLVQVAAIEIEKDDINWEKKLPEWNELQVEINALLAQVKALKELLKDKTVTHPKWLKAFNELERLEAKLAAVIMKDGGALTKSEKWEATIQVLNANEYTVEGRSSDFARAPPSMQQTIIANALQ